ncbi:MAG: spermine/spermidine synthase domain-containing protein, partial [Limisphaerales bacterium]
MTRSGARSALLHLIFFFSGVAGLGYQVAWSRMLAAGLGHEMPAVLAIVAAFMGGMALGAGLLDRAVSRSRRPGRWYGALEILIGLWGMLSTALIPFVNQLAPYLIGLEPSPMRHWAVAFALPFLVLLPATAAMGATLPAMERFVSPLVADGCCVAALYAANTFGAMTGTLVSAFVILPALGLRGTVLVLALVNLLCGVAAWAIELRGGEIKPIPTPQTADALPMNRKVGRGVSAEPSHDVRRGPARQGWRCPTNGWKWRLPAKRSSGNLAPRLLLFSVFFTGLLGIGYETVGVRVLSQVLENTIYTFAAVLSVFLLGTAMGAALYQRFGRRRAFQPLFPDLLCGLAIAGLLGIMALARAQPVYDACRAALGDSEFAVLLAEMAVAAMVFGLPTIFAGAIFSQLVQAARRADGGVGQALACNTFGGALAPALFSVALLPAIGSKWTLTLISVGYLALLPRVSGWRRALVLLPLATIGLLPRNLQLVQVPPDGKLLEYREGVMASVAVVRDATGNRSLRVNNRFQMGGTGAADAERRHAHIPLLLHPAPKRALFLGLGTGITLGAATVYPDLRVDGVELLPEVIEVMNQFAPFNHAPDHQPQLKLYVADARRFVRATPTKYDVIVADLFHPARDGAGSLYTLEHFRAIRQRLAPGGLFCQWLPLHQLDETMLRVITQTFLQVFPDAHAYLLRFNVDAPVLGLIGNLEPPRYSTLWVEPRLRAPELAAQLRALAL